MKFKRRRQQENRPAQDDASGCGGDGHLDRIRKEGESFAQAADKAISRALSANSAGFLAQNRQQGGQ